MINSIKFPTQTKWFITYTDKDVIVSYGEVTPEQEMETGQPIMNVYDNEEEWLEVLIENGIDPYPEEISMNSYSNNSTTKDNKNISNIIMYIIVFINCGDQRNNAMANCGAFCSNVSSLMRCFRTSFHCTFIIL